MSYQKAFQILPAELLEQIQEYIEGESIYIPKREESRRVWGEGTSIRKELEERNRRIYQDYLRGGRPESLARNYYLSLKSIQRIIRQQRAEYNK